MEQIIPADALPKCDHCKKEAQQHEKFCIACGYPMQGTDEEKKKFNTLNKVKHISLDEYEGKVKSARTTLYVVAGVMALINQKAGSPQGNPNSELYVLAGKQANQ